MKRTFTKENTNIVKGIAILLIVCHHVFWNSFFSDGGRQVFLFSGLTRFLTRWGFCCNHIFSAITGYGIAVSARKNKPMKLFCQRGISLLSVFIPVYISISNIYNGWGGNGLLQHLFPRKSLEGSFKPNVRYVGMGRCL